MTPLPLHTILPLPSVHALAIGVFDGIHRGHREVIRATRKAAGSNRATAVLTFEPHPLAIIDPLRCPPLLASLPQREQLIRDEGAGHVLAIRFDQKLRTLAPEIFLGVLHRMFPRLQVLAIGHDWAFGRDRRGSLELLNQFASEAGFKVRIVPALRSGGRPVSSTWIRTEIADGHLRRAEQLLGRPYVLTGNVVHGAARGRKIGFATANIGDIPQMLPPQGVYACMIKTGRHSHRAVMNWGNRPTFEEGGAPVLEVHLLDFKGNLYGKHVAISCLHLLRPEQKFTSPGALARQIGRDIARARRLLI